MKKFASIALSLIIIIGFSVLNVSASSEVDYNFEHREYLTDNFYITDERNYIIPEKAILRVEQGATLYVDGNLQVLGTLKNYGTIVVRNHNPKIYKSEADETQVIGHVSISGDFYNYGKVSVNAATMDCTYSGYVRNEGTITLENEINPNLILFRVNSFTNSAGGSMGGVVENRRGGTINLWNKVGRGMVISDGAKFTREGKITK